MKKIRRINENLIRDNITKTANDDVLDVNNDSETRFSISSTDNNLPLIAKNWEIDLDIEVQLECGFLNTNQSNRKSSETLSQSSSILSKILEDEILREWLDNCEDENSRKRERETTPMTIVELNTDDTLSVFSENDIANTDEDFEKDETLDIDNLIKQNIDQINEAHADKVDDIAQINSYLENQYNQDLIGHHLPCEESTSQVTKPDSIFETVISEDSQHIVPTSINLEHEGSKLPRKRFHRRKNKRSPLHLLREITSLENSPLGTDKTTEADNGK